MRKFLLSLATFVGVALVVLGVFMFILRLTYNDNTILVLSIVNLIVGITILITSIKELINPKTN